MLENWIFGIVPGARPLNGISIEFESALNYNMLYQMQ